MTAHQNAIKAMVAEDYVSIKDKGGYRLLGDIWGVSVAMAWRLVKRPDYWPTETRSQEALINTAYLRGLDE